MNCMNQYSMAWFVGHFTTAIDNTDKVDDVQQRTRDLIKYFTNFIFIKVCRGLFEEVRTFSQSKSTQKFEYVALSNRIKCYFPC